MLCPPVQARGSWGWHRGLGSVLQTAPGPIAPALLEVEGSQPQGRAMMGGTERDARVPHAGLEGSRAIPAGWDPAQRRCRVLHATG